MIGGQIQLTMSGKSVLLPHVQSGKMRAIAVTAGERWPELPDVGTLVEASYMDAAYDTIFGIVAPAGTPATVIATLNAAINDGLQIRRGAREPRQARHRADAPRRLPNSPPSSRRKRRAGRRSCGVTGIKAGE